MSNFDHTYAVIMAGGGGTRLWPVSRRNHPKQIISLIEENSLFQGTLERLEGIFPSERILVVTVAGIATGLAGGDHEFLRLVRIPGKAHPVPTRAAVGT